ncbi:MAG: NAD(P)/FAD-dependent oxidoreductase [Thermodesulfobacteriota bacterium]
MDNYDLAIVGGSFGGLTCASAASARGLKTVVFDKKISPDASTQTTGIFVKEIADKVDLPSNLIRKIHGVRLYSPNFKYIDLISPGYYFIVTDTCQVLKWFAEQAEKNGSELRYGVEINRATNEGQQITFPDHSVSSSYLVGADGAKSKIAEIFNLGVNKEFLLGTEYEVGGIDNIDEDFLHVFLDSELAPGYIAWLVPGVNLTQIGVATKYPNRPNIPKFYNKIKNYFELKNCEILNRRGGYIPCGGPVKPIGKDNICLLGDAAGFVSPMTAGGIHPAVEIGRLLGIAISDFLQDNGFPPEKEIKKHIPSYRVKRELRRVFDIFPPPNFLLNFLINNTIFRKTSQLIFFHHRGLLSKKAWNEILGSRNNS